MKFKKNLRPIATSDVYYDLTTGGYIKPEKILEDKEDIARVKHAIVTLEQFIRNAINAGVIEEI